MQEDDFILHRLADAVNGRERLVWRGRHLNTVFLLESGESAHLITVAGGRIAEVRRGAFRHAALGFRAAGARRGLGGVLDARSAARFP